MGCEASAFRDPDLGDSGDHFGDLATN
ncbi:hypothetical protein AVEN_92785-1, partial [Araneus ventricosus]